jgi:arylsulfatase A-like enzyme
MARRFLHITALAALVAALSLVATRPTPRPNVLLVSIDSLRSDHLHAYGYPRETSPTIDALAREGALFTTALSSSSWTLPAHITLLTARPPEGQAAGRSGFKIWPETATLADTLQRSGYATAGFVSGPFLAASYGYGKGFEIYDESAGKGAHPHRVVTSPKLVTLTTQWLTTWYDTRRDEPFFLFLHMWDPHYDYDPPPPYDRMFDPDYAGDVDGKRYAVTDKVHAGMDPRDLAHVVALYDGEIRFTDDHLGRIVEHLRGLGVLDDTIVVVTSDHGEEFFEHGMKGHGKTLYEEIVRIPLVMRYPRRIAPGTVVAEQVRLMDVAPTILGLAKVPPPAGFGSGASLRHRERDLSPWLTGEGRDSFPTLLAFADTALVQHLKSVRSARAKLITTTSSDGVATELYDLASDPGERRNLATSLGVRRVRERLVASTREWDRHWRQRKAKETEPELQRAHASRLRALGYVE